MYRPVLLLSAVACEITIQYSTIGITFAHFTNISPLIIQLTNAAVFSCEKLTMIVYFWIELGFFCLFFLQTEHRLLLSCYWSDNQ